MRGTGNTNHVVTATSPCLNCHGGDGFGNIHGTTGTYSPAGSGGTWNRYRFLPGGYMSFAPGANKSDADFTSAFDGTGGNISATTGCAVTCSNIFVGLLLPSLRYSVADKGLWRFLSYVQISHQTGLLAAASPSAPLKVG